LQDHSIIEIRSALRRKALHRRDGISEDMRDAYSQLIRKKTIAYIDSISAKCIHIYLDFRSEVLTKGIIEDLFDRNIKVVVPLIRGEKGSEHIVHSHLENLFEIHSGKFGVPEPVNEKIVASHEIDSVILPVVAFDGDGVRLGYGKGYYDRFLNGLDPKVDRIGLAFSVQEMDKIPMLSHDQLMYSVVTEQMHFIFKSEVQFLK
jgi:5-formyltetrahydrofolate cyclo-ligase